MTSLKSLYHCARGKVAAACGSYPLYTPTMLCIEGAAAILRGEIDGEGLPENHYLCNGLDLYLTEEPDLMSSMALVHSRIRKVYYLHSSLEHGALGSLYKIHSLSSLNHHFRVFKCNIKNS